MLKPTMHARTLALALALLLLLTQQFGALHSLSHSLAAAHQAQAQAQATTTTTATANHVATPATSSADSPDSGLPADSTCQVCLVLAALGLAALPGLLRWWLRRVRQPAPTASGRPTWPTPAAAQYRARAPPARLR